MTPQEEAGARLIAEAYQRWETMPPINLAITRIDAYAVMMALQGMITHPAVPPKMAEQFEHIGRQLMESLCDTPEIYAMSEAGWNRAYDVEPEEAPREP